MLKNNLPRYLLLIFVLTFATSSCSKFTSKKEEKFSTLFADIPLQGYLSLTPFDRDEDSKIKIGDKVGIHIVNISDKIISLPYPFLHYNYIYDEDNQKWILLGEEMNYGEGKPILLYPSNNLEKGETKDWLDVIKPSITPQSGPVKVRVVVIGEIVGENSIPIKKVGGYIDVDFKP